jgi:hypothetical protein
MARPIYPHELADPDFQWLISTFRERRCVAFTIEESCLPVILLVGDPSADLMNTDQIAPAALGERGSPVPSVGQED